MYLVGHRRNPHSNQDTQASIESYHAALKQWMKIDNHQLQCRRLGFLVWRLTTHVVTHYMYNHGKKLNGVVLNKRVKKIVAWCSNFCDDYYLLNFIFKNIIKTHHKPRIKWNCIIVWFVMSIIYCNIRNVKSKIPSYQSIILQQKSLLKDIKFTFKYLLW